MPLPAPPPPERSGGRLVLGMLALLVFAAAVGCFALAKKSHTPTIGPDETTGGLIQSPYFVILGIACCVGAVVLLLSALRREPPPYPFDPMLADRQAAFAAARRQAGLRMVVIGIAVPSVLGAIWRVGSAVPSPSIAVVSATAAIAFVPAAVVGLLLMVVGFFFIVTARSDPWAGDPEVDAAERALEAAAEEDKAHGSAEEGWKVVLDAPSPLPWERK